MAVIPKSTSWSTLALGTALLAFYAACLFGWMINRNNSELVNYKKTGIETTAKVLSKSRTREGSKKVLTNHLQLSYSIGSLETGDFAVVITEITKFVTDDLWEKLEPGDSITIVYLKTDPGNNTILKESLVSIEGQLFSNFLPTIVCAAVGIFLVLLSIKLHAKKM